MNNHTLKLPIILAMLGIIAALVPAVEKCAGADTAILRDIHYCKGVGCNDNPNWGEHYTKRCNSWCCPGMNGVQYDSSWCGLFDTDMNECCRAGSPDWVVSYTCVSGSSEQNN